MPDRELFPALSPGLLVASTRIGGVVYDTVTEQLSFVNPSGAALCVACREGRAIEATLADWATAASTTVASIRPDVDAALGHFDAMGWTGRDAAPPAIYPPVAPVTPMSAEDPATVQAVGMHRIRFRSADPVLIGTVATILDLACDDEPTAEFRLVVESDASIRLTTDTEWHFPDRDALVRRLVVVVNDFVARTTTDVVLHAAVLRAPDGSTVVCTAAPGSGKSTLAGTMLQHRWGYGGDESATIRTGDLAVVPCAKPVGLDAVSCAVLGVDPDLAGDVPPAVIAPDASVVRAPMEPPAAIIVPCYAGPDGEAAVDTLDVGAAIVALVGGALNLRYVGTTGLETLVALAEQVPVHRLSYRSSEEAVEQLAGLGFDSSSTRDRRVP